MEVSEQQDQNQKPGFVERVADFLEGDRKKWGGMTLGASARLGLAELREAFSLGGNVAQPTPYGMYGTLTPGEVAAERRDDWQSAPQLDQEPLRPSEIAREQGPYGPDQGQDRAFSKPSEIARDNSPSPPEREDGQEHDRGAERGR